jgi:peptidoglycan hydrolase-like protein with peptidoglycan-binding domain
MTTIELAGFNPSQLRNVLGQWTTSSGQSQAASSTGAKTKVGGSNPTNPTTIAGLQKALGVPQTGKYDAATRAAVTEFQKKFHLQVDGIAGNQTMAAFNAAMKAGSIATPKKAAAGGAAKAVAKKAVAKVKKAPATKKAPAKTKKAPAKKAATHKAPVAKKAPAAKKVPAPVQKVAASKVQAALYGPKASYASASKILSTNNLQVVGLTADTAAASTVHHPLGRPGGPGLFRMKGAQLPAYIQNVAKHMDGPLGRKIQMAIGIVRNWAEGHDGHGNRVSAEVQAAAVKAIAEYDALRAAAKSIPNKGGSNLSVDARTAERVREAVARKHIDLAMVAYNGAQGHTPNMSKDDLQSHLSNMHNLRVDNGETKATMAAMHSQCHSPK